MAVLAERRPTADVDMLATSTSNDVDEMSMMVREVLDVDSDDGVEYLPAELKAGPIRDHDVYPGVRISVPARIDRARAMLRVDINVGDPVTPGPTVGRVPGVAGGAVRCCRLSA